jgi:adenylosuccinate lyase
MITRYARPAMTTIWEPQTRFAIWLEIETLAAEAMAELGQIPADAARAIRTRGGFDVARIDAIEREVKHDVIAFLTSVAEHVGPEARYMHLGMTSSDVLDTCLSVQLTRATDLLIEGVQRVLSALKARAMEHRRTLCIGRSHGIHAEPTTFGLKLAGHHAEFARNLERLRTARAEIATCAISGPVGTFATVDPRIEAKVAKGLGLVPETVSTQVIPRDRHAAFFSSLAVVAASHRAPCDRDPAPAANRGAGGGRVLLRRAEGLLGHAAQAQSGADGESHRPCAPGPLGRHAGAGECCALA